MNKETLYSIIFTLVVIATMVLLWPLIKWFILIILVLAIILFVKIAMESKKVKEEIQKDPQRHYNNVSGDVINAEYTEKEIEE
jgi:nitrate/nitrite transporter NarK